MWMRIICTFAFFSFLLLLFSGAGEGGLSAEQRLAPLLARQVRRRGCASWVSDGGVRPSQIVRLGAGCAGFLVQYL
jgi:hypothetical protein